MTIRELRNMYHLSQAALAERLGVAQITVSAMETGRMKVSARIAESIRKEFGVEVDRAEGKTPVKLPVKEAPPGLTVYIQSPYGGNITPEEIAAKMPEGTECCYVRVDQNLIWWVRGNETGAVAIWSDRA